jgi:uncharacterized protein YdhG (YjbR/CyaY superfamily)
MISENMSGAKKIIRPKNVDEYISGFPPATREALEQLRAAVRKAAPAAIEAIKYDMPTFSLKENLVSFGAWKYHIGFYPAPRNVAEFKDELAAFEGAKSTLKIPLGKPLPLALISRIVQYRVKQSLEKIRKK